jgi:peptidyl-prolyl cis-trans isomerase SurA
MNHRSPYCPDPGPGGRPASRWPCQAQGLRVTPQLGASRPAAGPVRPAGPRQADYIVAVVNSEPITNNEVRSGMVRAEQQMAYSKAAPCPRAPAGPPGAGAA